MSAIPLSFADQAHSRHAVTLELRQPVWAQPQEVPARAAGVPPEGGYVHSLARGWKGLQQLDPVVQLYGGTVKIAVDQEVVQANAHLQDALVQVANFAFGI